MFSSKSSNTILLKCLVISSKIWPAPKKQEFDDTVQGEFQSS